MPTGTVSRYSTAKDTGFITTSSGGFSVRGEDMEPQARFEGANVEFDVQRDEPHDRAVNVTLREGTRHAGTQRRFGDTR